MLVLRAVVTSSLLALLIPTKAFAQPCEDGGGMTICPVSPQQITPSLTPEDWEAREARRADNARRRDERRRIRAERRSQQERQRIWNLPASRASRLADQAEVAYGGGRLEDALALYRQALALDPDSTRVRMGLINILLHFTERSYRSAARDVSVSPLAGAMRIIEEIDRLNRPGTLARETAYAPNMEALRILRERVSTLQNYLVSRNAVARTTADAGNVERGRVASRVGTDTGSFGPAPIEANPAVGTDRANRIVHEDDAAVATDRGSGSSQAIEQARDTQRGRGSIGGVMEGRNDAAVSEPVRVGSLTSGLGVLSPQAIARYSRIPGFSDANRAYEQARQNRTAAERRRSELTRTFQSVPDSDLEAKRRAHDDLAVAEQAERAARQAQWMAEDRRDRIIRVAGPAIVVDENF